MRKNDLDKTTGLTPDELSEVLQNNPRAYMAVRGAVAEKHLENQLEAFKNRGIIKGYRSASGDMDKDFYLTIGDKNVVLECKNVEVVKVGTKREKINYLNFLEKDGYLRPGEIVQIANDAGIKDPNALEKAPGDDLDSMMKMIPQSLRESGIAKYEFSASQIKIRNCQAIAVDAFINQFENDLTVDFQRTRNSTDKDGDKRRKRLYAVGEIDIVAVCLFSRTMEWQFLYGAAENFERHKDYSDRHSNRLTIKPGNWFNNLKTLLALYER